MAKTEATIEDLYRVPEDGKAEIVNGELVLLGLTEALPGYAAGEVFASLRDYVRSRKMGRAVSDNSAFIVDLPDRKSFSPHAAFYVGPRAGMGFFQGAPVFAVEVRGADDYGPEVEAKRAVKRADYFAAGTQVVWNVDLLSKDVVRSYHADNPDMAAIYRRGEIANAEPAVPGWRMLVNDLFPMSE